MKGLSTMKKSLLLLSAVALAGISHVKAMDPNSREWRQAFNARKLGQVVQQNQNQDTVNGNRSLEDSNSTDDKGKIEELREDSSSSKEDTSDTNKGQKKKEKKKKEKKKTSRNQQKKNTSDKYVKDYRQETSPEVKNNNNLATGLRNNDERDYSDPKYDSRKTTSTVKDNNEESSSDVIEIIEETSSEVSMDDFSDTMKNSNANVGREVNEDTSVKINEKITWAITNYSDEVPDFVKSTANFLEFYAPFDDAFSKIVGNMKKDGTDLNFLLAANDILSKAVTKIDDFSAIAKKIAESEGLNISDENLRDEFYKSLQMRLTETQKIIQERIAKLMTDNIQNNNE